jgi:hypothetical protein
MRAAPACPAQAFVQHKGPIPEKNAMVERNGGGVIPHYSQ